MDEEDVGDAARGEQVRKDTSYSPSSARETRNLQRDGEGSPALDDPEIDEEQVRLLPGTGGPDDPGDVRPEDPGPRS